MWNFKKQVFKSSEDVIILPPVNCVLSSWSNWGQCVEADTGYEQTRTRTIITPASNGGFCGNLIETRICESNASVSLSNFNPSGLGVGITDVTINAVRVTLVGNTFPILGQTGSMATIPNENASVNSSIAIYHNYAIDRIIRLTVDGISECILGPAGATTFTRNLLPNSLIDIILDVEGAQC